MRLPEDFIKQAQGILGERSSKELFLALEEKPPVSVRRNPFKTIPFKKEGTRSVPWCPTGYYLAERPNFTFDPLLHAGCYYVQEAASMFLDCILRQYVNHAVAMLDLCAAPGGKSTLACAALPEGSLLFCNEPIRNRAQILSENIQKFGITDVIVTNNYPADYRKSGFLFDIILCDVPCSGEGMFRKDEQSINEWSLLNVKKCQQRQREIIADAWECLHDNGLFIYSTCTFNTQENEENVQWIANEFDAEILPVKTEKEWNITGSLLRGFDKPVYRFIPSKTESEGLFMAVLRKRVTGEKHIINNVEKKRIQKQSKRKERGNAQIDIPFPIINKQNYVIQQAQNAFHAIPHSWNDCYEKALRRLKVIHAGIKLGTTKGKEFIPDQSLALSINLDVQAFNSVDVNFREAISYLRKETLTLPPGTPLGTILITYQRHPIGFVKNIGNRANNLYPQEWRIKSTHVPDEENTIQVI